MQMPAIAHELRVDILRMFYKSKSGHLAPALSCVDIFTALYFGNIIRWEKRFQDDRDRVILSKGHACAALYATLARAGFFPREELLTFYQSNSRLGGHPSVTLPGIETPTGALGHGICFGTGTALAAKLDHQEYRTYVVMGDGESQEGSVWEAAMFAANHHLDNLVFILDYNGLQASSFLEDIAPLGLVEEKWKAFGWDVISVDGHDFKQLQLALSPSRNTEGKPLMVVAHTIKGKGLSIVENNPEWHSRAPKEMEWQSVCQELGITMEDLQTI